MEFLSNIKIRLSLLLIVSITLCSCCSLRVWDFEYVECKEIPKEAVNIAIKDYSKRLHRQKDTNITAVQVMVNYTSTDWFYLAMLPWIDEANKFNRDYLRPLVGCAILFVLIVVFLIIFGFIMFIIEYTSLNALAFIYFFSLLFF